MRLFTILLVAVMQLFCISAYPLSPIKTKDSYYGKKVTLYPPENGYYKIVGATVGGQQLDVTDGKLYDAVYGDDAGVFLGIELTLKDGRHDYISFSIADAWKVEKDEDGVSNFVCGDEDTVVNVYALNDQVQGMIIVIPRNNFSILLKYDPKLYVKMDESKALETILDLDAKAGK